MLALALGEWSRGRDDAGAPATVHALAEIFH